MQPNVGQGSLPQLICHREATEVARSDIGLSRPTRSDSAIGLALGSLKA